MKNGSYREVIVVEKSAFFLWSFQICSCTLDIILKKGLNSSKQPSKSFNEIASKVDVLHFSKNNVRFYEFHFWGATGACILVSLWTEHLWLFDLCGL